MAGTHLGGVKASRKNKEKYDEKYAAYGGFYAYIGQKGGKATVASGKAWGFMGNPELAREAGRIGGSRSRRGPSRGD